MCVCACVWGGGGGVNGARARNEVGGSLPPICDQK